MGGKSFYSLRIACEEYAYDGISSLLQVKPKELGLPNTWWIYEIIEGEDDEYYDFINKFLDLLEGKYSSFGDDNSDDLSQGLLISIHKDDNSISFTHGTDYSKGGLFADNLDLDYSVDITQSGDKTTISGSTNGEDSGLTTFSIEIERDKEYSDKIYDYKFTTSLYNNTWTYPRIPYAVRVTVSSDFDINYQNDAIIGAKRMGVGLISSAYYRISNSKHVTYTSNKFTSNNRKTWNTSKRYDE